MSWTREGQAGAETQSVREITNWSSQAPTAVSNTKAKTGTYSFLFSSLVGLAPMALPFAASAVQGRAGAWINHNDVPANAQAILLMAVCADGLTIAVRWFETDDTLRLVVRGVTQDTDAATVGSFSTVNTWRHIGLVVKIDATVGFATLYIDGVAALTFSGNTGTSPIVAMAAGGRPDLTILAWASSAYIDDFYAESASGAEVDEFVPQRRFQFSLADGNGASSQWSGSDGNQVNNYQQVDDAVPDDASTYNEAVATGLVDDYTVSDVTLPADHAIIAVIPYVLAKRNAFTEQVVLRTDDGALDQESVALDLPSDFAPVWARFESQPDASAWNETDYNASQFGIESAGSF
jgi:hypothetical protein